MSSPEDLCAAMQSAIVAAMPDAEARVQANSPGHFEVHVTSAAFEGKTPVKRQQLVYGAIGEFLRGDAAPVHAIDQMTTRLPG